MLPAITYLLLEVLTTTAAAITTTTLLFLPLKATCRLYGARTLKGNGNIATQFATIKVHKIMPKILGQNIVARHERTCKRRTGGVNRTFILMITTNFVVVN